MRACVCVCIFCILLLKELKRMFQSITLCLECLTEEDNVHPSLNPVVAFIHYCIISGLFPCPQECTLLDKCCVVDAAVQL